MHFITFVWIEVVHTPRVVDGWRIR